jgi:hypothetical protein
MARSAAQLADGIESVLLDGGRRLPCSSEQISALERRLTIRVPDDVRDFYRQMDGTDGMTTVDRGLVTLWPLDRWTRVKDESFCGDEKLDDAILIADHSISCWGYAATFAADGSAQVDIYTVGVGPREPIASSFAEFVELILAGDQRLYGAPANGPLQTDGASRRR